MDGIFSARDEAASPAPDTRNHVTLSILEDTVVDGQVKIKRAVLHFRWDRSSYESNYLDNAEAARQLVDLLQSLGTEYMDSVTVVAYASPEGVYEHNMKLSRERAQEFSKILDSMGGAVDVPIRVNVGGEAWALLRERVVADEKLSATARRRVLRILDNTELRPDTKKWRFSNNYLGTTEEEGDVYRYLLRNHYRYLRCLEISIHYKEQIKREVPEEESVIDNTTPEAAVSALPEETAPKKGEAQTEEATQKKGEPAAPLPDITPQPTPLPIIEELISRRPVLGISTNIPYDITWVPQYGMTSIPSFSIEYYPAVGQYTFGGDVEWPMWQHPEDHRYLQINDITLWGRRYFKPAFGRFSGPYALANINVARYGIGFNADKGWEGEGAGISAGGGWKIYLSKHIFFDAGAALGFFYSAYDPYVWGNDATGRYYYNYSGKPEDFTRRNHRLVWFGPTRVYLSIGFDLFTRKR